MTRLSKLATVGTCCLLCPAATRPAKGLWAYVVVQTTSHSLTVEAAPVINATTVASNPHQG